MGAVISPGRVVFIILCILLTSVRTSSSITPSEDLILVVSQNTTLELLPSILVQNAPGSKPGAKVLCERLRIQGLPRLKHLEKFPNSVRVKVTYVGSSIRPPPVQVCFHRNSTIGIGMCPQGQWENLNKGVWMKSMSPFDHKFLDIRMGSSYAEPIEVSLQEEVFFYRVIFLVLGMALLTLASFLSNSLVFYYSGAMTVGVLLVILMVLFQGMKLLPTGRKSSLALSLYAFTVGLGSFLLSYLPRLLRTILNEIGISEDMYNPLGVFLFLFLGIAGSWLGFWVVRKLVLAEDGSIDVGVSHFVAWSIRILASVMILQSSNDPLLAVEALLFAIFTSLMLRRFGNLKYLRHLYRKFSRLRKLDGRKFVEEYTSPVLESCSPKSFAETPLSRSPSTESRGYARKSPNQQSSPETFYSIYHRTPERRKFSKEEWNKFTKDSTKAALESLVSSPDFREWAVAHADRLTLAPKMEAKSSDRWRWFR
ncbi:OLC1v1011437C1 [Oldenlandia corymbosa var. corymbosa]|uniref:OLC1v1011437C1 n=1 Tax=Oldenlandia corymbosa var. corymbosa TaxID=529605 RepID=A0AAV1DU94_OLDCO|nr:OLC1v1011437C1 [Oldenlandia corymbosa var. corymbosa]